jgi:hypothetical protein
MNSLRFRSHPADVWLERTFILLMFGWGARPYGVLSCATVQHSSRSAFLLASVACLGSLLSFGVGGGIDLDLATLLVHERSVQAPTPLLLFLVGLS